MSDIINKTPEQKAGDHIDRMLAEAGWLIQSKNKVDLTAGKSNKYYIYQNRPFKGQIRSKEKS